VVRSRPKRTSSDALAAGWADLRQGRWRAARAAFDEALADRETATACEGLSWAAWWQDDAETLLAARERAYRLYRAEGDPCGAARMATWLAVDHLDFHGAWSVAAGWLRRAHRLLDPLEPGPDHGWLAFHDGYLAHAGGDTERTRMLAASVGELGRRFGVEDLEMLGLALEGAALVASGQVQEGMGYLDEDTATALAADVTIPISGAWTCCFLVSACASVLDFERAFEWCDRIAEFAERYGSRYMLAFCRAEYGAVHLWRGRWPQADAALTAAIADFSASRPAWAGGPLLGLAELRRRQGRPDEAARLIEDAGAGDGAYVLRARLALDAGDASRTVDLVEGVLRRVPADRLLARFPALELLARARLARGEVDEATSAAKALREVERVGRTAPLSAFADLIDAWSRPHAATTTRPGRCSRTRSRASSGRGRRTKRLSPGRSWQPASACSGVSTRPGARRAPREPPCSRSVARRRQSGPTPSSRRRTASLASPGSRLASGRCCPCSRRASRTGRLPSDSS
jgi:tetratricopeptide (TPR) repeat protein